MSNAIKCAQCGMTWEQGGERRAGMPCPACGGNLADEPASPPPDLSDIKEPPIEEAIRKFAEGITEVRRDLFIREMGSPSVGAIYLTKDDVRRVALSYARYGMFCEEWSRMYTGQVRAENELKSKLALAKQAAADWEATARREVLATAEQRRVNEALQKTMQERLYPPPIANRDERFEGDMKEMLKPGMLPGGTTFVNKDWRDDPHGYMKSGWLSDMLKAAHVAPVEASPVQDGLLKVFSAWAKTPKPQKRPVADIIREALMMVREADGYPTNIFIGPDFKTHLDALGVPKKARRKPKKIVPKPSRGFKKGDKLVVTGVSRPRAAPKKTKPKGRK